jgi:hypothetical protein
MKDALLLLLLLRDVSRRYRTFVDVIQSTITTSGLYEK